MALFPWIEDCRICYGMPSAGNGKHRQRSVTGQLTEICLFYSYIVDFEDCVWDDKPEWKDLEYFLWGLAQMLSPTEDRW